MLRSYLKPQFGIKTPMLTKADWEEFKNLYGPRCRRRVPRNRRKVIRQYAGKFPEQMTFDEFLDYHKPNSCARFYLKELWPQLTAEEQEVVINLNEWAFMFPASFDTQRQYRVACAFRLERFFGRKFHPKKAGILKVGREDAKFGRLVEGAMFR